LLSAARLSHDQDGKREGIPMNSSTLTGAAAVLFCGGIVVLLAALFRDADHHGGPLLWAGLGLLAATVACWFAAAQAEGARE
jgi:hypothetical protein